MNTKKIISIAIFSFFAFSILAIGANNFSTTNVQMTASRNLHSTILMKTSSLTHEHVNITNSNYELVVGWDSEPAYAGVYNGIHIEVNMFTDGGANVTPVLGAETNLTVIINQGGLNTSTSLQLNPIDDAPGTYSVPIIPSTVGPYNVYISGILGTTQINQKIAMDNVNPVSGVIFPNVDTNAAQDSSISALNNQIGSLNSQLLLLTGLTIIALIVAVASIAFSYVTVYKGKKN